ncbi:MAG: hypothetical protein R3D85_06830 [Paracoccaceae bacterium]
MPLAADPEGTEDAAQTLRLMQLFMAGGMRPLAVFDPARGKIVMLESGGALMQTRVLSVAASTGKGAGALAGALPLPPDLPVARQPLLTGEGDTRWLPYEESGGAFEEFARFDGVGLRTEGPEGRNWGKTGLVSAGPLIPLLPRETQVVQRLGLRFDMSQGVKAVVSLVPDTHKGSGEWGGHDVRIAREVVPDKGHDLVMWVRGEERARLNLTGPDDLAAFTLVFDQTGTVAIVDEAGQVRADTTLPDRVPDAGWYLFIFSEAVKKNGATGMVLEEVTLETTPRRPAGDAQALALAAPRRDVLFDGASPDRALGAWFMRWRVSGGNFAEHARLADGALLVDVPEGVNNGVVGLASPEPVIWLDRFEPDGVARLTLRLDPARTTGFGVALLTTLVTDGNYPNPPTFMADWVSLPEGGLRARAWSGRNPPGYELDPGALPETVTLELVPGGVRVLAEGVPDTLIDCPELAEGHGLRLLIFSQPGGAKQPVRMALRDVTLERRPSLVARPLLDPAPGIEPLGSEVLFNGLPHGAFDPIGIGGAAFDTFARYDGGALHVELPKKYQWSRTGLLSVDPVVVLDERVRIAPYRLRLDFDPVETDTFRVMLSPYRHEDMWEKRRLEATLVRETEGRRKGQYRMSLGSGYYNYWTRWIDAEKLMSGWDGGVEILVGDGRAEFALNGVTRLGGDGFGVGKGSELFMTVTTVSARPYGPAAMVLNRIEGGWASPPGMDALTRTQMVDDDEFDPEAFLNLIGSDLTEDLP